MSNPSIVEKTEQQKQLVDCLDDLQKAVQNACTYFGNINEEDMPGLLRAFKSLHESREYLSDISKVVDALHADLAKNKIPKLFEAQGIDSMKLAGRNFILGHRFLASVDKEKSELAFQWLREHGLGSLIQPTVNAKSLSSALSTMIEETNVAPSTDVGIKVFTEPYISVRKM